jgi:hypothetical protein
MKRLAGRAGVGLAALTLVTLSAWTAGAALQAGDYVCLGASGILIDLGFKLAADGSYTDLNSQSSGRVSYSADGGTVTFVGGHLAGKVGRNAQGGRSFRFDNINCQRN